MSLLRRWTLSGLLVLALILSAAAWYWFAAGAQAGSRPGTLESGGRTRQYYVHVPPTYDGKTPLPLVLVLHGATQRPEGIESMSGMSTLADKEKFLAVYPRGTGRLPTWNSGA